MYSTIRIRCQSLNDCRTTSVCHHHHSSIHLGSRGERGRRLLHRNFAALADRCRDTALYLAPRMERVREREREREGRIISGVLGVKEGMTPARTAVICYFLSR